MRRGGFAISLVLILAGIGVAEDVAAQYFGQNKVQYRRYEWSSITSDHFEVYFYPGLDSLGMRVLDLAEKTNDVLSKRMGHVLTRRVPIIVYGTHNEFAQTNITPEPIDANTGGFTELLRNRVVLPFSGSYESMRHVVVHELVHAFMFDMLYGGSAAALIARQSFFSVPLWFAEGMAEYFSLGIEPNAEMFLRDGIVEGYLPPLPYSGGYLVYKQGQSAISYLVERHGEDRLRDVLKRIRQMRNFDRAFQRSLGVSVGKFDEQWRNWLRREYWPTVASKEDPERFARQLTDHKTDESNFNTRPAVSPDGDRIAYFTDRRQYTDVCVMSALDGKLLRRLVRAERSVQFESVPSFTGALTWSPDGERIATTAKSGGKDVLYVLSSRTGVVARRIEVPCEALRFSAWSPVSDSIVVVGTHLGLTDLWMVNVKDGAVSRLTRDAYDEKDPTWTPDGRTLTFASDRLAPVVLNPLRQQKGYGAYGIFGLDLATGEITRTLDTYGDDQSPAWSPDGRKLAFVSERGGAPNVFLFSVADSSFTQLTDVLGGIQSLSWSRQNDRLVFSAFSGGGFDVFAVKEPLSLDGVLERLKQQSPHAVLTPEQALVNGVTVPEAEPNHAALAEAWRDTVSRASDSLVVALPETPSRLEVEGRIDTLGADATSEYVPPMPTLGPIRDDPQLGVVRDTLPKLAVSEPLPDSDGPFALSDSVLGQPPTPYRVRLSPDYAGGGVYASAGFGFVGSTQFLFSDFLGDHSLYVATDIFTDSFEETNALAIYNYLPRRWDMGVGVFHFKNYFSSRVTTLGEQLNSARLFSDRNFGALVSLSYPFDRFRRIEFNYTQMFVDRQFFSEDVFGAIVESGERQFRSVSSPSVSLVGDNSLFGYYGPVNGARYNLTYSPALPLFGSGNSLSYHTLSFDGRHYWDLSRGYTFATRAMVGFSMGHDAQTFQVGGYSTLRGFSDFDSSGSRVAIANIELRFPFIQQLGLVGPVPLGFFNLRGAVFTDFGMVWDQGEPVYLTVVENGVRRLGTPMMGFGTGIRTSFSFLLIRADVAWATDWVHVTRPRWHVSLGPEF